MEEEVEIWGWSVCKWKTNKNDFMLNNDYDIIMKWNVKTGEEMEYIEKVLPITPLTSLDLSWKITRKIIIITITNNK